MYNINMKYLKLEVIIQVPDIVDLNTIEFDLESRGIQSEDIINIDLIEELEITNES